MDSPTQLPRLLSDEVATQLAEWWPVRQQRILVITGEAPAESTPGGQGKTSLLRAIALFLNTGPCPQIVQHTYNYAGIINRAMKGRPIFIDNLASLKPQMSDALAHIITGGGVVKRTRKAEQYVPVNVPAIILSGYPDAKVTLSLDVLRRCVVVTLPNVTAAAGPEEYVQAALRAQLAEIFQATPVA